MLGENIHPCFLKSITTVFLSTVASLSRHSEIILHTEDLSTFEALEPHLTNASSLTNSCRVLWANCTISIFLSRSVFLGNLQDLIYLKFTGKSINVELLLSFVTYSRAEESMREVGLQDGSCWPVGRASFQYSILGRTIWCGRGGGQL